MPPLHCTVFTALVRISLGLALTTGTPAVPAEEIFDDLALANGLHLSAIASHLRPLETRRIPDAAATPRWRLAQWGTRHDLAPAAVVRTGPAAWRMENAGKHVELLRGGLGGRGVILAVHGGAEYGDHLRAYGEAWPHLLLEQRFTTPVLLDEDRPLRFRLRVRVEQCETRTSQPLDPALHTAQVTAFWTVHNQNPDSPDHREMIWFGIPVFDARHRTPPGHAALDLGKDDATNKFIYTVDGAKVWADPPRVGHNATLDCDLLPHLREALAVSQAHGYLRDTRLQDLALTTFNFGWEVPGPYDAALHLQHLSLTRQP